MLLINSTLCNRYEQGHKAPELQELLNLENENCISKLKNKLYTYMNGLSMIVQNLVEKCILFRVTQKSQKRDFR